MVNYSLGFVTVKWRCSLLRALSESQHPVAIFADVNFRTNNVYTQSQKESFKTARSTMHL